MKKKFFIGLFIFATIGLFIFAHLALRHNTMQDEQPIQGNLSAPIEIPEGNIIKYEEAEKLEKPMVVMFYVDWCTYCRRFMPIFAKYSEKFIKDFSTFDHYINKIRNDLLNIKRYFNGLRGQMDVTGHAIDEVYNEVNNFYDYIVGLYSDISDLRKIHYHEFKVTSHALVKDKTIDEYENLIYRVEEELSKYKNIEEAYDYIVYNSGNEIMELVEEFLKINSKQTSRLTYHYFLQTDAVIAFKHHEWVDLFVKFNYVMNKLKDVTYSKQFCTKFQNLETKYAIITIYSEINR